MIFSVNKRDLNIKYWQTAAKCNKNIYQNKLKYYNNIWMNTICKKYIFRDLW